MSDDPYRYGFEGFANEHDGVDMTDHGNHIMAGWAMLRWREAHGEELSVIESVWLEMVAITCRQLDDLWRKLDQIALDMPIPGDDVVLPLTQDEVLAWKRRAIERERRRTKGGGDDT